MGGKGKEGGEGKAAVKGEMVGGLPGMISTSSSAELVMLFLVTLTEKR